MAETKVTLEFLSGQVTTLIEYVQDLCAAVDVLIGILAKTENNDPAVLDTLAHLRRIRRAAEERTAALKDEPPSKND
jgi:hypothetical protein